MVRLVRSPGSQGVIHCGPAWALVVGGVLPFFNDTETWSALLLTLLVAGSLVAVISCFLVLVAIRVHYLPDTTGKAALLGQIGTVRARLSPTGRVQVLREDWAARTLLEWDTPLDVGQQVRVVGMRGLTLYVEPVDNELATFSRPIWFGDGSA